MKTKVSPALVGVFVLGAMLLALIALFSFGGINFFAKPQRFVVYFDESIHGLDLGSQVKLRGVRLGRVVGLNIRYSATKNESVVAVICELSRNTLTNEKGELIDVSDRGELQKLIDHGLRAQLGVLGLATGLLYVELDFGDPDETSVLAPDVIELKYAVVPAVRSTIAEFQQNLTEILTDFKRIDFAGLAKEIQGLLVDTRRQVNGLDMPGLTREWTKAARSVEALASSKEISRTFENLNGAVTDLRKALTKFDGVIEPTSAQLSETLSQARTTLAAFSATATTARAFINSQSGLGDEATRALVQLSEAAASIQRLTDFLERNPNALLTGKKSPR